MLSYVQDVSINTLHTMKGFINLLNAKYAIEPSYGLKMAAMAYLVLNKQLELSADVFEIGHEAENASIMNVEVQSASGKSEIRRVGVLSIDGPMVRNDQLCGPDGTVSMGRIVQDFDNDPSIDAIIIKMFTPGGQSAGGETFSNIIANTQKPVVVHGEMICSLGYWVASGASHIMLTGKNAIIGSIGTMIGYYDFTEKFEKEGISWVQMVATKSPDKNALNFDNPTEEDRQQIVEEVIDPINETFLSHIQEYRSQVNQSALTGKVYYAEQAIELGLADSIGTFADAVNLALSMSDKNQLEEEKMSESTSANAMTTANDDGLRMQLETAQSTIRALNGQVEAQSALIEQQKATIHSQQQTIDAQQSRIDQLAQKPSDDPDAAPVGLNESDATNQIESQKPAVSDDPVTQAVLKTINDAQAARKRKGGNS